MELGYDNWYDKSSAGARSLKITITIKMTIVGKGGVQSYYMKTFQKKILTPLFRLHGFHPCLGGCLTWENHCDERAQFLHWFVHIEITSFAGNTRITRIPSENLGVKTWKWKPEVKTCIQICGWKPVCENLCGSLFVKTCVWKSVWKPVWKPEWKLQWKPVFGTWVWVPIPRPEWKLNGNMWFMLCRNLRPFWALTFSLRFSLRFSQRFPWRCPREGKIWRPEVDPKACPSGNTQDSSRRRTQSLCTY